jgi:voltage-gated potassium channel
MHGFRGRLILIGVALAAVLAAGTVGYIWIAGYPPFDAFYMALITITTVGYSEIQPLGRAGRIFNTFIVLFGVTVMFFAIGAITEFIVKVQLVEFFGRRRARSMIEKLQDHHIVCGFGRVGRAAAAELQRTRAPFVVVDRDPAKVERALGRGMLALAADATSDDTLRDAGILRAKGLIAALATDAENLFLILSAKALNPNLRVAARVNEEESEAKLRRAGADALFRPYQITGFRLAQAILRPYVFEFLDLTTSTVDLGLNVGLEQVRVAEESDFAGKSLRELQIRRDLGVIVLAIRQADGRMYFNPPADAVVRGGDYLVVMGDLGHLRRLEQLMTKVTA